MEYPPRLPLLTVFFGVSVPFSIDLEFEKLSDGIEPGELQGNRNQCHELTILAVACVALSDHRVRYRPNTFALFTNSFAPEKVSNRGGATERDVSAKPIRMVLTIPTPDSRASLGNVVGPQLCGIFRPYA